MTVVSKKNCWNVWNKQERKKGIAILLSAALFFCGGILPEAQAVAGNRNKLSSSEPKMGGQTANIATKCGKISNEKEAALRAYSKILKKKTNLNEEEDFLAVHFAICDMNGDGVPELILSSEGNNPLWIYGHYTYRNGKVIKLRRLKSKDSYPGYGGLICMPSRKTYAFFRGGPAYDDEKGHSITPHIIMEYKIVGRKIKLVNTLSWYDYHKRKDKYYINGKPGTAKKYKAVSKSFGKTVTFYPNSSSKRRKLGVQ